MPHGDRRRLAFDPGELGGGFGQRGVDLGLVRGKSAKSPQYVDKRRVATVSDDR